MNRAVFKIVRTEKTHKMIDSGVYVFLFQKNVTKKQIMSAVEKRYAVKVDAVNTIIIPRRKCGFRGVIGVTSVYKKAYVKLANDMKINLDNSDKDK